MKPPVRYPEVQEDARSPKDAGLISVKDAHGGGDSSCWSSQRGDLRQIRGTWRTINQTCLFVGLVIAALVSSGPFSIQRIVRVILVYSPSIKH